MAILAQSLVASVPARRQGFARFARRLTPPLTAAGAPAQMAVSSCLTQLLRSLTTGSDTKLLTTPRSAVKRSFFPLLATSRTRLSACVTLTRFCARRVLCRPAFPFGSRPSLHQLRRRLSSFVRWLPRYYGGIRLLAPVHHWLRLLAFPMRTTTGQPAGQARGLPVPVQGPSAHARVFDHAGPFERSR
jgi:hypothetical protein